LGGAGFGPHLSDDETVAKMGHPALPVLDSAGSEVEGRFEHPSQRRDAGWPALGLRKNYPHIFRIVLFLLVNFWINEEQED